MANWGSFAVGVGAGYLAAKGWKKKAKSGETGPNSPGTHRGYGYDDKPTETMGAGDAADSGVEPRIASVADDSDVKRYANGGLVGAGRWYGKKMPK
jgi:hypothetical protein